MESINQLNKSSEEKLVEIAQQSSLMDKKTFREKITDFSEVLNANEHTYGFGTIVDDNNPLEHFFGDGTYIRKITMPANQLIVTKIHKVKHPYFILTGSITVITEDGVHKLSAPHFGITMPGTQRIIYVHEECVFITVHPTSKTDVEEIVKDVTAEDFNDPVIKID